MSLSALIDGIQKEVTRQRHQEQEALQEIAAITSQEFAEQAAGKLDSKKHVYSFEAYLVLLERLKNLIYAGMPNCLALDAVQTGEEADKILQSWRFSGSSYQQRETGATAKEGGAA